MASAFASALRAGKVSGFGVDGKRTDHARARWLDIDALARHLLVDDEKYIRRNSGDDDDDDHLEIPIFVFDQRFDGEHKRLTVTLHQCKTGGDRSRRYLRHSFEPDQRRAHLGRLPKNAFFGVEIVCEIKTLESDFADPAREVASAVAQFVSGLIAPHETASFMSSQNDKDSEETGSNVVEAINGYAWSVGDNPLSFTTPGSRFGSIHRDIARRNIVVAQIDRVLSTYNRAVSMLERVARNQAASTKPSKAAKASAYPLNFEPRRKLRFGI